MGIIKYFRIREDETIIDKPIFLDFRRTILKSESVENEENILYVKSTGKSIDYMDKTLLLVSDEFKEVSKIYHEDYIYKIVILQEEGKASQRIYWNIEMPDESKCLTPSTTFKKDGTLDKIVINEKEVEGLAMFRLKNRLQNSYIIRLDMAESLLRRSLVGFILEELEHE